MTFVFLAWFSLVSSSRHSAATDDIWPLFFSLDSLWFPRLNLALQPMTFVFLSWFSLVPPLHLSLQPMTFVFLSWLFLSRFSLVSSYRRGAEHPFRDNQRREAIPRLQPWPHQDARQATSSSQTIIVSGIQLIMGKPPLLLDLTRAISTIWFLYGTNFCQTAKVTVTEPAMEVWNHYGFWD